MFRHAFRVSTVLWLIYIVKHLWLSYCLTLSVCFGCWFSTHFAFPLLLFSLFPSSRMTCLLSLVSPHTTILLLCVYSVCIANSSMTLHVSLHIINTLFHSISFWPLLTLASSHSLILTLMRRALSHSWRWCQVAVVSLRRALRDSLAAMPGW